MDKATLGRLLIQLPEDATDIIVKGLDTTEIFFCSNDDCSSYARYAQKGAYKGPKMRWRLKEETPEDYRHATAVDTTNLPDSTTTMSKDRKKQLEG